jgi:hypothetical protein
MQRQEQGAPQCKHCKRLATPRGARLARTLRAAPGTGRLQCQGGRREPRYDASPRLAFSRFPGLRDPQYNS